MKEENPFDEVHEEKPDEEYYFFKLNEWKWVLSEDLSLDDSVPEYDKDPAGRVFATDEILCPLCNHYAAGVSASYPPEGDVTGTAREWVCLNCGQGGDVVGSYGNIPVHEDKADSESDWVYLPSHIVVTVDA